MKESLSNEEIERIEFVGKWFKAVGEWFALIGNIILQASDYHRFKAIYPDLVSSLTLSRESLDELGKFDSEFFDWAEKLFFAAKYFVEGMKDIHSWNFETQSLDRAASFIKAFIDNVPENFRELMKEAIPHYLMAAKTNTGLKFMLKGQAKMTQGSYKEAAANFEEAIPFFCKSENKALIAACGILETNYWFAKAMAHQYEDGSFNEAAKAFEKASELSQREANKAAIDGDIFNEGMFQSNSEICDRRASICKILHKKVETSPEYKSVREKLNTAMTEFENMNRKPLPRPITVLFLAANPAGTTPLDLNKEFNAVDDELYRGRYRDHFNLEQRFEIKPDNISEQLLRHNPHIVHFSGHGSKVGEIILEDANGRPHPVDALAITNLFSVLKDNIRCVVLNACYSKLQALLISRYIDCVIGMSKAIGDEAAIKFAQGFYRGIAFGRDLETAFKLGCAQIDLQGLSEEDTPKIIWKNDEPKIIVLA